MKNSYYSIGLMSGTSLDGLDIALCKFKKCKKNKQANNFSLWSYEIIRTECVEYNKFWKKKLENAHLLSALHLKELETEWTDFLISCVNKFVLQSEDFSFSKVDCISLHGHTVFHQPLQKSESKKEEAKKNGFTLQIGNGAMLSAKTGFDVVCDFRQTDVALGGQGAPLVPIGDQLLFSDYDFCLNLGGIANISFNKSKKNINSRFAFDICPCNMVLNYLSNQLGFEYDKGGKLAKKGKIDKKLLENLNNLDFYKKEYPKSLGREWVEKFVFPLLKSQPTNQQAEHEQKIKDLLHTLTYHSAFQIAEAIQKVDVNLSENQVKLLVTGGGAYNTLLVDYVQKFLPEIEIIKNDTLLIAYKEALVFAFLGVLRLKGETNTLASVTGAIKNSCGGSIYLAD